MGQNSSKIPFTHLFGNKTIKILLLGLDGAGKTTLLYKLMLNETVSIATLGYNVETIQHKHLNLTLWDLAGDSSIRSLWKPFYNKCSAIIFVVDSSDKTRISEAALELNKLMKEEELKNCSLLIFATKQDLPDPIEIPELTDLLGLHEIKDRKWYLQPTRTLENVGIYEGLDWLSTKLQEEKKAKSFKLSKLNPMKSPSKSNKVTPPKPLSA
ncbi:ADP-ribosylation factor-related protein [Tieghemostelium lacteum]|uniref:ADP-ribosylation factor-related protein n=1 Tax=Tieghemostelium lacteum TaxID=361077 RepID=A0A152A1N4_TIELA|nr:ADP-ribosylation factor-related protein [Tieghemostelium lacteum]|eukprot:KYR00027.1 ADP-ribosylation factor-related protein [Tieghemostelium lacteum]